MKKRILGILITLVMLIGLVTVMSVSASAETVTEYDLWVGGVQVTSANKDNIVVPGAAGTATYDPDTKILTLNNFSYTGEGYNYTSNVYALIYTTGIDLKIVLKDTNTFTGIDHYQKGIIIENGSLTIANSDADDVMGSLKLTAGNPVIGVNNGSLSVENVNLTVINTVSPTGNPGEAIFVTGNISITNSDVKAISGDSNGDDIPEPGATFGISTMGSISVTNSIVSATGYYGGMWANRLSVTNSIVTAAGDFGALCVGDSYPEGCLVPTLNGEFTVTAGNDAASAVKVDSPTDATYANKYVRIEPVKYDLYIGGVQFTSGNLVIDSTDSAAISGTATYDPDTKILTLNNFSYEGDGYMYGEFYGYGNYAAVYSGIDLTVKLVGTNNVTSSVAGYKTGAAFCVQGALIITDDIADNTDSVLNLTGCSGDGLFSEGVLTIENVTVKATGVGGNGIYCENAVNINNAIVSIESDNSQALYSYDAITVNNSNVTVSSDKHLGVLLLDSNVMNISNSTVEITAGSEKNAIFVAGSGDDELGKEFVPVFDSAVIVKAGDDAASATASDAMAGETYKNRYVKIIPARNVTVNYGVDGVDNKEITARNGDTISLENPVIDGYLFMGWFTDTTYQTAFDFTNPITANTTIYAKFADYEGDKEALNHKIDAAKADLQATIDAVNSALAGKADADALAQAIADLNTAKTNIQTLLEQIDDYKDADTALKAELITKIETADNLIHTAISDLTSRVQTLESELAAATSDISTNASEIAELTADLAALNTSLINLSNKLTNDYATKAELTNAINSATDAINSTIDALTIRVQNLEAGLAAADGKIDTNTSKVVQLTADLAALNTSLINLSNKLTNDYATKAELTNAINSATDAINSTIDALTIRVQNLEAGLAAADGKIDTNTSDVGTLKSDVAALKTWKTEAQDAINALKTLTGTQGTDIANLKLAVQSLEAELAAANARIDDIENKIAVLEGRVSALETAKQELDAAVAALNAAIANKADTATLNQKVGELNTTIAKAEAAAKTYADEKDVALKNDLTAAIATAKGDAITAAENLVNTAKAELQNAINGKVDIGTFNTRVGDLNAAIETAEAAAKAYTDSAVTTLNAAIITAKDEAVNAAKNLVDAAKAELQAAIDNNKADITTVNTAIANLQNAITALQNAKDNYIAADAALKTELEDAIAEAKQEAIDAAKGYIPYIGTNGNWWIGAADTGVDANGIKGDTGAQGEKGDTGAAGEDGVGIAKIEKTSSDGNVDTYTITLTDGTTYTFTVTNGINGTDGKDGINGTNGVDGKDGTDGEDGQTPYIGENGNWWIGDTDTGVKVAGDDGKDGAVIVATAVGGTALISNIALIAWTLIKKKRLF